MEEDYLKDWTDEELQLGLQKAHWDKENAYRDMQVSKQDIEEIESEIRVRKLLLDKQPK